MMAPFLVLLLALQLFYTNTCSKILNSPLYKTNSLTDELHDYLPLLSPSELPHDSYEILDAEAGLPDLIEMYDNNLPVVQTFEDETELKFRQPIEAINIDYARNAVLLKFHKNNAKSLVKFGSIENEKKKSLQDNFIRFGKRSYEESPSPNSIDADFMDKNLGVRLERSDQTTRDARGDNFMRFGRSGDVKSDFMRFGRAANDFMRFGRSSSQDFMRFGHAAGSDNFMRFGRTPNQDFMRLGRIPSQDFMRFGRTPSQDFMRFGRTPSQDFMRFGRTPSQDFMRFGRTPSQDFMRFGRTPSQDFMRFGRAGQDNFMRFGRTPQGNFVRSPTNANFMRNSRPDNFMRFGRAPPQVSENFMRFGKSMEKANEKNSSQPLMDKNELKQAVKLIHESDQNADNENPVDKAIKALFDKHEQADNNDKSHSDELNADSSYQHNDSNDQDSVRDYV